MEEYDFDLTNNPAELEDVQRQLQSMLQASGLRFSFVSALNVALGEWLENIIQYAYSDGAVHHIAVHCQVGPAEIVVRVTDDGRPFNACDYPVLDLSAASKQAAQTGRGIHLIRHLVDRMDYQRQGASNVVTLTKRLK